MLKTTFYSHGKKAARPPTHIYREKVLVTLPFLTQKREGGISPNKKEGNSLFYFFHAKGEILLVGGKDANSGANSQNY